MTNRPSDTPKKTTSQQNPKSSPRTGSGAADGPPGPMEVLRQARAQLAELTGTTAESVSSFEQAEDGWALEIEVLELARIPDTTSLLASYQVDLDPQGGLTGYRRIRRYERGRADAHAPGGLHGESQGRAAGMTALPAQQARPSGATSGLYDVLELVLDRGLVIDVFVRVALVGIEILKIDVRVVVASVDTYLRFAEACNRLDLEAGPHKIAGRPDVMGELTGISARTKKEPE